MANFQKLADLFHYGLRDVYSVEKQLIDALPEMAKKASNSGLKDAFTEHWEETKTHKQRLDDIAEALDMDIDGATSEGMQGIIKQAKSLLNENYTDNVKDAGMIAEGQRVEHYEISAYGSLVQHAKTLRHTDIANTLKQTQDEEANADQLLNDLLIDSINKRRRGTDIS
jgi:ferritin-like metal-binding protein YciE